MKKTLVSLISLLAIIAGTTLNSMPASAIVWPKTGHVYYTVGESVSLDLGCQEAGTYSVTFASGVLPDGLTINPEGLVTGTPTKAGDYPISN
jgi:hypothetical protein